MGFDSRYMREILNENGELKIEINFVDYIMSVLSDSGKFHVCTDSLLAKLALAYLKPTTPSTNIITTCTKVMNGGHVSALTVAN